MHNSSNIFLPQRKKFGNKSRDPRRQNDKAAKKKKSEKASGQSFSPHAFIGERSRQLCETRVMKAPSWKPVENKLWKDLGNP